jgi:hypothetical protein
MTRLRVCTCGHLIAMTKRKCEACARADSTRRNTRTKRDGRNTQAWTRTRAAVLTRAGHECELHHRGCTGVATHVHHLHHGWHTTNTDDYVAACPHCHGMVERARQGGVGSASRNAYAPKPPTNSPREKLDESTKSLAQPCGSEPLVA